MSATKERHGNKALSSPKIRACWSDYDFSSLEGQPRTIQRLAALYEYARESDVLISDIADFRKYRMDCPGSVLNMYPWNEVLFLGNVHCFPQLSFKKLLQDGLPSLSLKVGEVSEVEVEPASEILRRFEYSTQYGGSQAVQEFVDRLSRTEGLPYLVIIRWGRSPDAQLVGRVAKLLLKRRRQETSGRIRPGRRGMPQTTSGIDYLHQLSVFRFQKGGGTYGGRPSYLQDLYPASQNKAVPTKGWNKAFNAAAKRIAELPFKYLFS